VSANSPIGQDRLSAYAANWFAHTGDAAYSNLRALGQFARQIQIQATVMTYSETFYLLGLALLACVPLAMLLRTPRGPQPTSSGH
jgi:DHA2 family multidrug resistance protein